MTNQAVHLRINKGIYTELGKIKDLYEVQTGQYISINFLVNMACSMFIENDNNLDYIKNNQE